MNIKESLLFIILTLVLGYFLGLMISSTVDYKLNDLVINLPKNNIVYKTNKENNLEKKVKKLTMKMKDMENKKEDKEKKIEDKEDVEDIEEKDEIDEIKERDNDKMKDKMVNKFDMDFTRNMNKMEKDKKSFKFKPFNDEDMEDNYSKLL